MRNAFRPLSILVVSLTLAACGGGGGGGGGGNNGTNTPGPTPTVGPPVGGGVVFVRTRGSDSNDGLTPDTAKRTIDAALLVLPTLRTGKTVIVGPGSYSADLENLPDGTRALPVVLFADQSGEATLDGPGDVRLMNTTPDQSVVRLREAQWVTLDGFSIRGPSGANLAAIEIRNSADITVRNCEIFGGSDNADGISLRDSNRVLLFNNLVADNDRRGILVAGNGSGSSDVQIVNNTVVSNGNRGIGIGTSTTYTVPRRLLLRSEPRLSGWKRLLTERSRQRRRHQRGCPLRLAERWELPTGALRIGAVQRQPGDRSRSPQHHPRRSGGGVQRPGRTDDFEHRRAGQQRL